MSALVGRPVFARRSRPTDLLNWPVARNGGNAGHHEPDRDLRVIGLVWFSLGENSAEIGTTAVYRRRGHFGRRLCANPYRSAGAAATASADRNSTASASDGSACAAA